jgi:hypothetical protein
VCVCGRCSSNKNKKSIVVFILLLILLLVCPHNTIYVPSYNMLCLSSYYQMRLRTTPVLIFPDVSSYYGSSPVLILLILLYMCPHTNTHVFSYLCILVLQGTEDVVRVMMLLYYYIRVMMLLYYYIRVMMLLYYYIRVMMLLYYYIRVMMLLYYYMRILILLYICVLVLLCICMHIRCARRG